MAITLVGAETATTTGEYGTINDITIPYPAGLAAGDVIHLAVCLPRYRWRVIQGLQFKLIRQYGISIPTGWTLVQAYSFNSQYNLTTESIMYLLRRIATGAEGTSVTVPITRTDHRPDLAPVAETLQATAVIVAHSGVALGSLYEFNPVFKVGGDVGWGNVQVANSRLVQLGFAMAYDPASSAPAIGESIPAWPDPSPTKGEPAAWDLIAQEATTAVEVTSAYESDGVPADELTYTVRGAAFDTDTYAPGEVLYTGTPTSFPSAGLSTWLRAFFALRDAAGAPTVDEPPTSGQVGVTGSGSLTPEWDGRARNIATPLACSVWGETDGSGEPEIGLLLGEDEAAPAVGLEATFNGLGACTSAQAAFAAFPGLIPYQHALKIGMRLMAAREEDPSIVWWAGVVKNTRYENGLYTVDLDGLWALLNDARIQLDSGGEVDRPSLPGIIDATLVLGVGDPTAVVLDAPADAQQSWGAHYNNVFRATPQAAWGVGPDQVFVQGLPEQGGVLELDANAASVTNVQGGEFILPPFVTEWWAETSAGAIVSAELTPAPGLLTPQRVAASRVDALDNLLMPKEAQYPTYDGPTYELEYAGIAIPPLRVVNLPGGISQMVASARVRINVGEEGSMPRIITVLTTVALPY